jgi:glycosyltransferase involved in cell wall biosynthesis
LRLLIISSVWVEPNSSAAGARMLQLIALFQKQGFSISYASTSKESVFAVDLQQMGIDTQVILLNDSSFDVFIKALKPDVVLFDRFMLEEQFGWRVADFCPTALRVLDTEDLHCLRAGRELALKEERPFQETDLLDLPIAKREIASILRCDLSLMISTYEMDLLTRIFKIDKALLFYIPFLLDNISKEVLAQFPSFETRKDFYFVGNFLHKPNYDAVLYLKNTIWPLLSKHLPKTSLYIYGAYPPQKVMQLHNPKQRFFVAGRATDLPKTIQNAKICLAPIRFGAGLKGKLLEAMQYGTPSVTTRVGAEAMASNLAWSGTITDDVADFVAAAVTLYTDEIKWQEAQQNGLKISNTIYDIAKYEVVFGAKINYLLTNIQAHRKLNFLGAILQQESLRSTKFMALWIEGKSKKASR